MLDYGPAYTPGITLFTVIPEDTIKFLLVPVVHYLIGAEAVGLIHTHVQGSVGHIRKAPLHFIQLRRRHAQIKEHAVHALYTQSVQYGGSIRKISVDQGHFLPKGRKTLSCPLNGGLIPVYTHKAP